MTEAEHPSSDRTVLLLGAGASKGSEKGLPSMEGFFGPTLESMNPELRQFLIWFYGHENLARYNLEEVLSYLDLAHARVPKWTGRTSMGPLDYKMPSYELLLDYIANRLKISDPPCTIHRRLLQRLDARDTILTLNYDLVCDKALKDLEDTVDAAVVGDRLWKLPGLLGTALPRAGTYPFGEPVALTPSETATGFYLKLHGSLDWLYCPNSLCPNGSRYYPSSNRPEEGQEAGQPCRHCGNLLTIFVVPPIATKFIGHEGRLAFLWGLALNALANAKKIIVVGVSFTQSDQELRWLIRQSRAFNASPVSLDLVNPVQAHREAVLDLVRPRETVKHFVTLEDYLEDHRAEV